MIQQATSARIFVETGNFTGGTTLKAKQVFDTVFTIELSDDLYHALASIKLS